MYKLPAGGAAPSRPLTGGQRVPVREEAYALGAGEEGDFDTVIDSRPESEIHAEGEESDDVLDDDLDDADISSPYQTRENNYFNRVDTSDAPPEEGSSEEGEDEESDDEIYRRPVRPQGRRPPMPSNEQSQDSEEDSEASEDTVRGTARRFYVLQPRPARRRLIIGSDQE